MTPAEFKTKWAKVSAKESAAYQSHFDDLCRLLMVQTPLEADPTGESFCFQKRVVKDVELFVLPDAGEETEPSERGFADVWKKGCFAWEYKGKKKNLDEAYRQLLRYRESLLNLQRGARKPKSARNLVASAPTILVMGLTIHFTLAAPPDTDAARAGELVRQLRRRALDFKQRDRVDTVHPLGDDAEALRWAEEWLFFPVSHHPERRHQLCVRPLEGFLFPVGVGEDCEPMCLGLCRYPLTVRVEDGLRRTNLRGWRFKSFCKTQYASLHGWEHFRRCHTAVIDLLAAARRLGLTVEITDEGDYWPGRDLEALRRSLDQMNAVVAAAAGVLKDYAEESGGTRVQSPILAHPHFERLEAEGATRGYASRLRRMLRRQPGF